MSASNSSSPSPGLEPSFKYSFDDDEEEEEEVVEKEVKFDPVWPLLLFLAKEEVGPRLLLET